MCHHLIQGLKKNVVLHLNGNLNYENSRNRSESIPWYYDREGCIKGQWTCDLRLLNYYKDEKREKEQQRYVFNYKTLEMVQKQNKKRSERHLDEQTVKRDEKAVE